MVTLAAFMEVLDTTIVNVSLPHIAGSMSVSSDESTWSLTTYLVANGIVLTISGALSRMLGTQAVLPDLHRGLHALPRSPAAFRRNSGELILFRALQGFFGGGLQPTQQAIILDTFPPRSAAPPSPSRPSPPFWRRCWARCWAAGSPTPIPGTGSS